MAMQESVIADVRSELASKGLLSEAKVSAMQMRASALRDERFGDELRSKDEAIRRMRAEFTQQQQAKKDQWASLLKEAQKEYQTELRATRRACGDEVQLEGDRWHDWHLTEMKAYERQQADLHQAPIRPGGIPGPARVTSLGADASIPPSRPGGIPGPARVTSLGADASIPPSPEVLATMRMEAMIRQYEARFEAMEGALGVAASQSPDRLRPAGPARTHASHTSAVVPHEPGVVPAIITSRQSGTQFFMQKELGKVELPRDRCNALTFTSWLQQVYMACQVASMKDTAIEWCRQVEDPRFSMEDFADTGGEEWSSLDAKLGLAIMHKFAPDTETGSLARKLRSQQLNAMNRHRIFRGRQMLWIMTEEYRVDRATVRCTGICDLVAVEWTESDPSRFMDNWDSIFSRVSVTESLNDEQLELFFLQKVQVSRREDIKVAVREFDIAPAGHIHKTLQHLISGVRQSIKHDRLVNNRRTFTQRPGFTQSALAVETSRAAPTPSRALITPEVDRNGPNGSGMTGSPHAGQGDRSYPRGTGPAMGPGQGKSV